MKAHIIVILLVLICPFYINGQIERLNSKFDSLQYSADSSRVLVYKRQKTGLYDLHLKRYLIKPEEQSVRYFEKFDFYLFRKEEDFWLGRYTKEGEVIQFRQKEGRIELAYPYKDIPEPDRYLKYNKQYINLETGLFTDSLPEKKGFYAYGYFVIEKLGQSQMLINDYSEFYGYLEWDEIPIIESLGHARSGVYNTQNKSWDIQPVYEKCTVKNDLIFCLKRDSFPDKTGEVWDSYDYNSGKFKVWYSYDIYQKDGESIKMIHQGITKNGQVNLGRLIKNGNYKMYPDSINYKVEYKGKLGIVRLQFFNDYFDPGHYFYYDTILAPKYDYIYYHPEDLLVIAIEKGVEKPLLLLESNALTKFPNILYQGKQSFIISKRKKFYENYDYWDWEDEEYLFYSSYFLINQSDTFRIVDDADEDYQSVKQKITTDKPMDREELVNRYYDYGLTILNDSLICITNNKFEVYNPYIGPIKSLVYPEEDSLGFDPDIGFGLVTYPTPEPGYDSTGVFNINQNNWFIAPHYGACTLKTEGILMEKVIRDSVGLPLRIEKELIRF